MFKKLVNFRMRSGIASVIVLVCLAWAGMSLGSFTETEYVEVEAALENAIAGSDPADCKYYTLASNPSNNTYCCKKSCNELDTCSLSPFVACPA
ncbi:hypothetical protein JYB64_01645 [Algoriphagus aestuarii]|nr:hypothetical protein [Algoriphagus aestuarii]